MMERLTKRNEKGIAYPVDFDCYDKSINLVTCLNTDVNEIVVDTWQKLAKYEDAEEQGRLVILPCKIGDCVYRINEEYPHNGIDEIPEWQITQAEIFEDGYVLVDDSDNEIRERDIGVDIFLTREQAEAALSSHPPNQ